MKVGEWRKKVFDVDCAKMFKDGKEISSWQASDDDEIEDVFFRSDGNLVHCSIYLK